MPIRIPDELPAANILTQENIFIMPASRAEHQDIRPLRVLILNLMPKKIETETQLLRLLSNSALQIDVELLRIDDRPSKNTPKEHLDAFYRSFEEIKDNCYDGFIITGAPLGQIAFEEVHYWERMQTIMDWSQRHVTSTIFLCWAAHAALSHFYGLQRHLREVKLSGVYEHKVRDVAKSHPLLRGFDEFFYAPHSRYAEVRVKSIDEHPELEVLVDSEKAGLYLLGSKDGRQFFVTGHPEYDPNTIDDEYHRDLNAGLDPQIPENYYADNDPSKPYKVRWRSHGNLLFTNWLNYHVYQLTPFNLDEASLAALGQNNSESI
jgi:homoserine O-succinyltransferase